MKNCWQNTIKYRAKLKYYKKKEIDSEPVFENKYLRTKIKSYKGKVITNFNTKVLKEESESIYWSAVVIGSIFKSGKNCYSQTSLEEYKYKIIEKEKKSFIKDDLGSSSSNDLKKRVLKKILINL